MRAAWVRLPALIVLTALAVFVAGTADARPLVVLLTSEDDDDWTRERLEGVRQVLGDGAVLAVEGLGLGRLADPVQVNLLKALLRIKYASRPPAVVAALDDDSAVFLADSREQLFPDIPAVYSRQAVRGEAPPAGRIWAAGVLERADIGGTIAAMAALQPGLLRLAVINNGPETPAGRAAMLEFRRLVRSAAPPDVELIYWENLPLPLLGERLRGLSARDAALLLTRDAAAVESGVFRAAQIPVYGVWGGHVGRPAVGGCLAQGGEYGRILGEQLRDLLAGRRAAGLAPSPPSQCVFDVARLEASGVDPDRLPENAMGINRRPGLLPDYRVFPALYWTAGLAAFGLAAVIAGLLLRLSAKEHVGREAEALARRRADQLMTFQETLDETRDSVFLIDENSFHFIYANRGAAEQVGYSAAELSAMTPMDLNPDIEPAHLRGMLAALQSGDRDTRRFQTVHRGKDGRLTPVDVYIQHVPGRDGRLGRFVMTARDIADIRATEAALRASEQRFELALAASDDGIWDWDLASGRIWFSPRWKAQLGYADGELENTLDAWKRLIFPDDLADALQRVADYNEGRIPAFEAVQRFRHKDGHTVYIHARAVHQKGADGRVTRMVGAHTDVTERQLAQLRLEKSEGRLRELAAAVPGMMFQWIERHDGSHGFVWVSPRARELFGVDGGRLLADWTGLRIHPDDLDFWRISLETSAATGVDWEFEGRILRGEGMIRWIKGLARPEATPDGVLLNGIFLDVTGERLLREETDRLRTRLDFLLNASPAIICAASADGRLRPTFLSAGIRQFGWRARQLLTEADWWLPRIHPDDRPAVQAATAALLERETAELSYRFRTGDGDWRWIVDHRVLVRDGDGRPLEVVGTMTDVSRVVEAEQKARQAQERLELVLQSAGEGIYGVDRDGATIFVNAATRRMTGFSEEELRLSSSHLLFHHSREDGAPYPVEDCPVTLTACDGVVRSVTDDVFWRKDGGSFPVEFVVTPLRNDDQVNGAVVVFRDVTEARRVRGELQSSLRRWEAVLSNSPVGIALTDRHRRFIRVNSYMTTLLGVRTEEVIGRSVRLVYPDDAAYQAMGETAYPSVMRGEVFQTELQLRRADGDLVWVNVTGSLIDADDPNQGGVWVLEDISRRKAQELALQEKTRELERSNAELEAFAYVASHDLRQPLRVVNSYLSLLERSLSGALNADAKEFIDFARGGAQRMDRLIVDLLEYSRVGRRSRAYRRLESTELAAYAVRTLEFAIADAGGEVVVADGLPAVFGDESELERLFQNLIGNAIKYHAPDRPPRVTVSAAAVAEGWMFTIADNGIGVPESQLERIFGIFQRLHAADAYEGSGIGLAICRKIVERHGGRIWAESVEGEGSVFHFILPAGAGD